MTGNQNWRTPPELLAAIGVTQWGLDAAADSTNAIGFPYLGPGSHLAEDTMAVRLSDLKRSYPAQPQWASWPVWLNPPYADPLAWVQWCIDNMSETPAIYLLVLADPSARWFSKALSRARECRLLTGHTTWTPIVGDDGGLAQWKSGRVPFIDASTGKPATGNTKPSALFIFDRDHDGPCHIYPWDWRAAAKERSF